MPAMKETARRVAEDHPELWLQFKVVCARRGKTMRETLREVIVEWLERQEKGEDAHPDL